MKTPTSVRLAAAAALLFCCAGCGSESTAPTAGAVIELTSANFDHDVLGQSGASVVEFYRPTCPHCQAMAPLVEQLAADYAGRARVGRVNTEVDQALPSRYQIEYVPTFVYIKDGREISRSVGEQTYVALTTALDAAIASH